MGHWYLVHLLCGDFYLISFLFSSRAQKVKNCPNNLIYITTKIHLITSINVFNHNLFQSSQPFLIITILFNHHNLFQSLYNLWHYLYESKLTYEFYHLTYIFYRQDMTNIFCQFHKFLIYAFCLKFFEFFSFCV